jgi:hypothetical protein
MGPDYSRVMTRPRMRQPWCSPARRGSVGFTGKKPLRSPAQNRPSADLGYSRPIDPSHRATTAVFSDFDEIEAKV